MAPAFRLAHWFNWAVSSEGLNSSRGFLIPRAVTGSTSWDTSGPQFPHLNDGANNSAQSGALRTQ